MVRKCKTTTRLELISIEVTDRCTKACSFCYSKSFPGGKNFWPLEDLLGFVFDCARNGVKAVSFGGGEPLQYEPLFEVLNRTRGTLFRSFTTNGLLLEKFQSELVQSAPDKIHVSVHFPEDRDEVERVIDNVRLLDSLNLKSGINFLVAKSKLQAALESAEYIRLSGIANDRIVYLPLRIRDTPSPEEIAQVAGGEKFQSMTCLSRCAKSERFCSISSDQTVGFCSYTQARRKLKTLTFEGILEAMDGLDLTFCGGVDYGN